MLTPTSLWNIKNRVLVLSVLAILLTACGKSGSGGGKVSPGEVVVPVEMVDADGIFSDIGVTSLEQLEVKVKDDGLIGVIQQVTEANPNIQAEKVVRLLNQNNRNIEYQKILKKEVPTSVVNKLKSLRASPVAVKKMVQLPEFTFMDKQDVSADALEIYNSLRLEELNRKLNLRGQNSVSSEEFIRLQDAFSQTDIVDNFGDTGKQVQNLIVANNQVSTAQFSQGQSNKTMASSTQNNALGVSAQAASGLGLPQLPEGYSYINPVYEEQELEENSDYPFESSNCSPFEDFNRFPRIISKQGEEIDDGFVGSDSGNAQIHFPQSGIAVIRADQAMTLTVSKEDGTTLVNESVDSGQYLYLPVQQSDICDAFVFAGASNAYDISLVAMVAPVRMDTHVYINGKDYLTYSSEAELLNFNNFFNPISYTFSSFDSNLTAFDFIFSANGTVSNDSGFDVLIYSPSGKIYSSSNNNTDNVGYQSLAGLSDETVVREPGIWRIDLLPAGTVEVNNQQLQSLNVVPMSENQTSDVLNITTLVTTDGDIKHKEFVLGTMKTVSFNTEGEDGFRNPGEVNVTLNTSMAPPLEIPTLLEDLVDDETGSLSDEVSLWQCWEKSEKTGFELESGNACEAFRGAYPALETAFEKAKFYKNHENISGVWVRIQEQCPQQWESSEYSNQGWCDRGIGDPYEFMPEEGAPQDRKVRYVLNDHTQRMQRRYAGEEFLYALSRHYDLYTNWVSRAVQVSTSTYPNNRINYKTYEHLSCNSDINCNSSNSVVDIFRSAAILEPNKPIFGVPVDRLVKSTSPITFDYTARDEDEYNDDAALFAVLEYVVAQTLNVIQGNFIGMICDSVDLTDKLHQVELAAEDDPLGSAKASINRYSTSDPFYGLHNTKSLEFYMSGVPEQNTKVDTYGQRINYAQLACGVGDFSTSGITGINFAANADTLLNLDYENLLSADQMTASIQAMAILEQSESMAENAEAIADYIRAEDFEAAKALLAVNTNVNSLVSDQDMYTTTDKLLEQYVSGGSAANGNNVVKSNVQYLIGSEKKTRANVHFDRVASIPASTIKVTLNEIKIIYNKESTGNADDAEVILEPYVGEVSDVNYSSYPYEPHGVFNRRSSEEQGIANLEYNNVKDGDTLVPETVIYNSSYSRNAAALYLELAILEDDGNSIEDDDMIGVFSETLKLEELFNKGQYEWRHVGGQEYQLVISQYPVYNADNQRVLENPLSNNYEQQKYHNRHRSPSALVTMTVDVTLNDELVNYPVVDTGLNPTPADVGKDTYSMEMSVVNSLNISDLKNAEIYDVLDGQAIIANGSLYGIEGAFYSYDVDSMSMEKLFSYDVDDFSGDLLPIKNSLYAQKSISQGVGSPRKKVMSLFKLLPNKHLLFVISTDDGAKIMVVSYNNQGEMALVASHDIKQIDDATIYTLLEAKLSPNREGLLIPYVPESYKGTDKTEAAHPRLAYYTLSLVDGSYDIHYHSTLTQPDESIQMIDFIGDTAVAVKSVDIRYVDDDSQLWNSWFSDYQKDFQNNCSSDLLSCYYAYYGGTISTYTIVQTQPEAHALILTEDIDVPYFAITYPSGEPGLEYRTYATLGQNLFSASMSGLTTVAATESQALLRLKNTFYQFHYDEQVSTYSYTGQSVFNGSSSREIHFNPIGQYYCAGGVVCSGYLKQAFKPSQNDTQSYTSDINIYDFQFADLNRDLLMGITRYFDQDPIQVKLSLLSLYNGAAFKGPQLSSDIFDTVVVSSGTNNTAGLGFTFEISDRDTRIDQLSVDVIATTLSTTKEAAQIGEHIYEANCSVDDSADNTNAYYGQCSATVLANFYNADLTQRIDVVVSDGVNTTTKSFTLKVEREAPILSNVSTTVTVQTPEAYHAVNIKVDSQSASTNVPSCTLATEYCQLIHNGYVDGWVVSNLPSWLTYNNVNQSYGHQTLNITGIPPMGAAGTYDLQVAAIQNTSSGVVQTPMIVTIIVEEPDVVADSFHFVAQGDLDKSTLVESNVITVSGINGYASLSINSTDGIAEYWRSSTNAWSSASATDIVNGEQIKLRLTSSDEYDSNKSVEITLAGVTTTFTVNTEADPNTPDSIPDPFSFNALDNQVISTLVESNEVTLSGFNQEVTLSVSGGEYSLDGSSWQSNIIDNVETGQTVWVRHTSSDQYETAVSTTLTVGGVSASFVSTTSAAPAPMLSAGGAYIEATINEDFSFIPTNSGGVASSWSITDKPNWADFNELTGELSGVVNSTDEFTINITATNSSGSDTFTATVYVSALESPYINGYSSDCSIDDDHCDYVFTDDSAWRNAITQVTITDQYNGGAPQILTSPEDYIITGASGENGETQGQFSLLINATNNTAKTAGQWQLSIEATNYNEMTTGLMISDGAVTVGNVSYDPLFEAGKITTVSTQLTNRFGFAVSYGELNLGVVAENSDVTIGEVYRYSGGSGFVWKTFNDDIAQNTLYSDENGDISFEMKLPGCIDKNDGFTLQIGSTDIIYNNSAGICIDTEWTQRYNYGANFSEIDADGNVYSVFQGSAPLDEYTDLGTGDIYVIKQDRNGEILWVKQVGTEEIDIVNDVVIHDEFVYMSGSSTGDLDMNDAVTSGAFLLRLDGSGEISWVHQDANTSIDSISIVNNQLYYLSDTDGSSYGDTVTQCDLSGENHVVKFTDFESYTQLSVDSTGNYYLLSISRKVISGTLFEKVKVHKFNNTGVQVAQSINFPFETYNRSFVIADDTVYVGMTTTEAMSDAGFDNEVLNADGDSAVRVAALRLDDLSIKWTQLIQSNDQYGRDSIFGGLVFSDNVVYVGGGTDGELYYDDSLLYTPNATWNLTALHAGDGSLLAHNSWIPESNFELNQYYSPLSSLIRDLSIGPNNSLFITGKIKGNFNQTTSFDANILESFILKTQLPVTAPTLPAETLGLSRNAYTEIVTDHNHELQWNDAYGAIGEYKYWSDANDGCATHVDVLGGGGWRLPTIIEMERIGYIPVADSIFDQLSDDGHYYWSSDTEGVDSHLAMEFGGQGNGDSYPDNTSSSYRCVRDMN